MGTGRGSNQPPPAAAPPPPVQASPIQNTLDTRYQNVLDWTKSGKDWTSLAEFAPHLNLYNSSVANNQNYAGEGLLSPNELSGGNTKQLGLISKQIADRRQSQAAGDAYTGVMDAVRNAESGGQWSAGMHDSRNMGNANMQNQRYTTWLGKPKEVPFWQRVLLGGMQVGGQLGAAALTP